MSAIGRWRQQRSMVALFTVGVITGTILSFEMGLLCRRSPRRRSLFGLGLAVEGYSIFLAMILVGI
jgi:cytochrome bd ubiquinol oxidase subunit I